MNARISRSANCALWLRTSTEDQTTENQRRDLLRLAGFKGYRVVAEFDLSGVSARRGQHRAFVTDVIKASRRNGFRVLLVWSIDRLSRQGVAGTLEVFKRLNESGIDVVSFTEPEMDTTSATGEFLIAVMAYLARIESDRISERTKAGMARARAQGKHVGRPRKRRLAAKGD